MLAPLHDLVQRRPGWVVGAFLLLTGFFGNGLLRLQVDTDVTGDLPPSLAAKQLYDRIDELFPSKEFIVVGVESDALYTAPVLAQIDTLTRALDALPQVQAAMGPTTAKLIRGVDDGGETRVEIQPVAETPPRTQADADRIRARLTEGQGKALFVGSLVSEDGQAAAILVSLAAAIEEEDGSSSALREADVAEQVLATVEQHRGELTTHTVGRPVGMHYSKLAMGKDMGMLTSAALLVIIVLLLGTFLSLRGMLLPLGVVVASTVWTLGLMGYLGVALTHSTQVMPILLIAIGVADGIHILKSYYSQALRGGTSREVVARVMNDLGAPVVMTSLTTVAGFLSLLTSGVPSIGVLGIFTGVGVLAAMVFSLTFLPAVLILLPVPGRMQRRAAQPEAVRGLLSERLAGAYGAWLADNRGIAALAVAVVFGFSVWGTTQVVPEMSTLSNYKEDHPFRLSVEAVNRHFAGTSTLMVVVEGEPGVIRDPAVLQAIDDLETFLRTLPHVGSTRSLVGTIKQLHRALRGGDDAYYRVPGETETVQGVEIAIVDGEEQIVAATQTVPGSAVVGDLLMTLEASGRPADFANAVNLPMSAAKVTAFLDSDRATVADAVHREVGAFIAQRFAPLRERHPTLTVELTGMLELMRAVNAMVVRGQIISLATSLLLVLLLNALLFRSLLRAAMATLPLSVCILFNFGFMGVAGFRLNLMTMVTANIAIGVGVDYAIHYVHRYRCVLAAAAEGGESSGGDRRPAAMITALRESGVAIFFNAVTVALGFACLVFSSYKGVLEMGAVLALTTAAAAFATLIVLPLLFLYAPESSMRS